jgi:plastocyanin
MKHLLNSGKYLILIGAILVFIFGAGCSSSTPTVTAPATAAATTAASAPPATPAPSSAGQAITIDLTAQGFAFSQTTITVPAGADVTINFNNKDSAPHNFAAYTDSNAATSIYVGKVITGPSNITYNFKAPATPGDYFFRCDVHHNMKGTLKVVTPGSSLPAANLPPTGSVIPSPTMSMPVPPPAPISTPAPAPPSTGKPVTVNLVAEKMAFDLSTVTVPAGASVTLNFNNKDAGIPHNVSVYQNLAGGQTQPVFIGDVVAGPASITYHFTAPSAGGDYFFICDVHPQIMTGKFVVTP